MPKEALKRQKNIKKAYKKLVANDSEREYMVKTGEIREINRTEEYHLFKGFLIGFCACIPLVILIVIHAIVISSDSTSTGVGNFVSFMYMLVFAFFTILIALSRSASLSIYM